MENLDICIMNPSLRKDWATLYATINQQLYPYSQRRQWHLENPMDGGAWWAAVHGVARVGHD